jgi:methionyl-tRNA formyltransferase
MRKNQKESILFLGKKSDQNTLKASEFIKSNFINYEIILSDWGEPIPDRILFWEGDYIISYLSRWIIPHNLIKRASKSAINFHPAPPDYPGIGCNNFALYNEEKFFGVTCHFMEPKVDSGQIILSKKFPISSLDNVSTLLLKTYDHQLNLFYEVMDKVLNGLELEPSGENWTRKPYTRKDLSELSKILPNMDKREIQRRIRATNFEKWKPYLTIGEFKFEYKDE